MHKSLGEHTGHRTMVKYGPSVDPTPAERLAKFAHEAIQDDARSETERHESPAPAGRLWTEGDTDWLDPYDQLVNPLPSFSSDPGENGSSAQVREPTLLQIMETIKSCHASLYTQIETIRVDFTLLKHNVHKVRLRVTQPEQLIRAVENDLNPLMMQVRDVAADHKSQEAKLGDIEDRLCRNILRFLGFPEGLEGNRPEEFLLSWLKQTFGDDSFSHLFAIEGSLRVPLRAPPPGSYPRPMLARFPYFRDKETILHKAHNLPDLLYNNNRISIFPDFSAATQKQRAAFQSVKQRLRECSLPYSMLYSAKLRVIHKGNAQFFTSPKEANHWLESLGSG